MTLFSEAAWHRTARLREAIHGLPFNTELALGSLSRERFQAYIVQDALYLEEYARVLAMAAARAADRRSLQVFAQSTLGVVTVERALHEQYFKEFGIDPARMADAEPSPDCLGYTSFLVATAYHKPWEVLVAALLPCFWIYWDVGYAIARQAHPANPYRAWINTYADAEFGEAVKAVIAVADQAPVTSQLQGNMMSAFVRSAQYEWLFWDGAYRQRGWPAVV